MSTSKRRTFTEKKAGYPKPKRQTPARGILAQWHRLRDHDEIPEGVFNDCDLVVSAGAETRTGAFSAMSRGGRAEDGNDPFAKLVKKNTDAPAVAQSIMPTLRRRSTVRRITDRLVLHRSEAPKCTCCNSALDKVPESGAQLRPCGCANVHYECYRTFQLGLKWNGKGPVCPSCGRGVMVVRTRALGGVEMEVGVGEMERERVWRRWRR